jgi:hypothetical protein
LEEGLVAGRPVEGGIGEDQIERAFCDEVPDVPSNEPQPLTRVPRRHGEHVLGIVDPDRLGGTKVLMEVTGQLAGAAAEVHDPHPRSGPDQSEEVVERLTPFPLELLIAIGAPRVAHGSNSSRPSTSPQIGVAPA